MGIEPTCISYEPNMENEPTNIWMLLAKQSTENRKTVLVSQNEDASIDICFGPPEISTKTPAVWREAMAAIATNPWDFPSGGGADWWRDCRLATTRSGGVANWPSVGWQSFHEDSGPTAGWWPVCQRVELEGSEKGLQILAGYHPLSHWNNHKFGYPTFVDTEIEGRVDSMCR